VLYPEEQCPKCKSKIDWKVVWSELGAPAYNGICKKCNIILTGRETPEVTRGKELERGELKNVSCLDRRITSLSTQAQLGILRQRQKHRGSE
jgi:hypothetical protein